MKKVNQRSKSEHHFRGYFSFIKQHPEAKFWVAQGLVPSGAKALVKAGIRNLDDLKKQCREDLLRLRGVGRVQLRKCEEILGQRLPSRADYWVAKGIRSQQALVLVQAGLHSIEDIEGMTREALLEIPFLGEATVKHCERLLGRPLPSYLAYWMDRGFRSWTAWKLAKAGLSDIRQLKATPRFELRKIGLKEEEMAQCLKS